MAKGLAAKAPDRGGMAAEMKGQEAVQTIAWNKSSSFIQNLTDLSAVTAARN